eukprot:g6000.t1
MLSRIVTACNRSGISNSFHRSLCSLVNPHWIFLGPPGVGKGTYSKRIAEFLHVPQISTGDLVREEISRDTPLGHQIHKIISHGNLLPDEMMLSMLERRLETARTGFVLDGFPRTRAQAEQLSRGVHIDLVINFDLREEVLIEKCMGRRICSKCKKDFNLADIYLKGDESKHEIIMPPIMPPHECLQYMKQREDDKEEVIRKRIQVYKAQAKPVEEFYRELGTLLDFEITGGIPETLPVLLEAVKHYLPKEMSVHGTKSFATA